MAAGRGANFVVEVSPNGGRYLVPGTWRDRQIAGQAIREVYAAMGFTSYETYFRAMDAEGPALLRRLPGVQS